MPVRVLSAPSPSHAQSRRALPSSFIALCALPTLACGVLPPILRGDTRPAWTQGAGAAESIAGRGLYGVGMASQIADPALRREVAEAAARADLLRSLRSHVRSVLRSYAASTSVADRTHGDGHTDRALEVVTDGQVEGARIVARHSDQGGALEYALAHVDAEGLRRSLASARGLTDEERRAVVERAEKAFEAARWKTGAAAPLR